jgi:hypothetical protein
MANASAEADETWLKYFEDAATKVPLLSRISISFDHLH